jgi:hypothetical protein
MSTRIGGFRPGVVTALLKVALIGSWNGRTFLDDNLVLDDVADFVPTETATPVRLPVAEAGAPVAPAPAVDAGHSVAA